MKQFRISTILLLGLNAMLLVSCQEQQVRFYNISKNRAQELSRMKSDFIQQISHEIRTPLNILSGFTQVLTIPDAKYDEATLLEIKSKITEALCR